MQVEKISCLVMSCSGAPGRGEADFEALLAASGFAIRPVPTSALHEEYRGGEYRVIRACLLEPVDRLEA